MFTIARLGRIWEAMQKAAAASKPLSASFIQLFISGDVSEETPLPMFLAALRTDAPPSSEAEIYRDTVLHFSHKRILLEALDAARNEIISQDFSVSSEELKNMGISRISNAFNGESDDQMKGYGEWGRQVYADAETALASEDLGGNGLRPGLSNIEMCIGRLLPGKLYVLAGMSSSGKSALARQIIEAASIDAAARGMLGNAYISSLEMTGSEYAIRHISEQLGIEAYRIEAGDITQGDLRRIKEHLARMSNMRIKVDQKPRQTIKTIGDRCRKLKNSGGITLAAIDHLILIAGTGKQQSISDRVSEATIEAKNLAKELQIPIIMLAQLDEKKIMESKSGIPNSTHLFGGQTITQNADVIAFVHRPVVVHSKKEPSKDDAEGHQKWKERLDGMQRSAFIFNNKRRGGAGNVRYELDFDAPLMTFSNK